MDHPTLPFLKRDEKGKVVSAADAVKLIRDGDTLETGGFVGHSASLRKSPSPASSDSFPRAAPTCISLPDHVYPGGHEGEPALLFPSTNAPA